MKKIEIFLGLIRIALGAIFLWAFLDKLFGLGFATTADKSWLAGGSPTYGFLKMGTKGPFAFIYQAMAGNVFVDWLFMIGLLLIGLALIFSVMVNLGCYGGALMVFLMWSAALPPTNHPVLDEHIIFGLTLILLSLMNAGDFIGFGKSWKKIVGKNKWLR